MGAMRKTYRGRDIEVSFDLDLCIHVGECLRAIPEVFELNRRPWVLPDATEADRVAEAVRLCPSGALQYRRLDGGEPEAAPAVTTVTPMRNGPLLVRGQIEVRRPDGSTEVLPRATLCRCGLSESKPFCDNSHLRAHFQAPGIPFKIHLSPVRPKLDAPMSRAADPRRE
jgi:uncharacterized Fe-S cluster protein YjdI/CDGSH-type Zn-finger protein